MDAVIAREPQRGWYWQLTQNGEDGPKTYAPSYEAAQTAATRLGYRIDNGGWHHKLLLWNWEGLSLEGWPGWEREGLAPASCCLEHVNSNTAWPAQARGEQERTASCRAVANAWDDATTDLFYVREFSYDGTGSLVNGEAYGSNWWFRTAAARDRFLIWVAVFATDVRIVKRSGKE